MRFAYQFQGPKVKVTRPTNAHTSCRAPYLPNGKTYELQTWYTDGGRRPALATGAVTSNVKGQGRKVTWSVWAVSARCCICVRGWRGHTVSAEPGDHTSSYLNFDKLYVCYEFTKVHLWSHQDHYLNRRQRNGHYQHQHSHISTTVYSKYST